MYQLANWIQKPLYLEKNLLYQLSGTLTLQLIIFPWAEQGSNLRTRERTDLQSVAFNHSAICPFVISNFLTAYSSNLKVLDMQLENLK
jgi:hypothetical protein